MPMSRFRTCSPPEPANSRGRLERLVLGLLRSGASPETRADDVVWLREVLMKAGEPAPSMEEILGLVDQDRRSPLPAPSGDRR